MHRTILPSVLLIGASLASSLAGAQVSVTVSPDFAAIHHRWSGTIEPGKVVFVPLLDTKFHDRYRLEVAAQSGEIGIYLFDNRDIGRSNTKPTFHVRRRTHDPRPLDLPASLSEQGMTLFLEAATREPVRISFTVFRVGHRGSETTRQLENLIGGYLEIVGEVYELPRFSVTVEPCGTPNAYARPDIIICSELLNDLFDRGLTDAIYPILLHELAHSLLYLWKLPGYENEDLADEFATIVSSGHPEWIEAMIQYLEARDPIQDAALRLANGDRHSLSLQRGRNMRQALGRVDDLARRWSRLFAPYEKVVE